MVARCNTKSHASYERYGGRGIRVCERWLSYENFLADMGIKPKGMTLDRKDNNLGYCKENCRWATEVTQARNRSNTIYIVLDGVSRPLRVWAELLGINPSTLASRIQHGMPPSEALRPGKMKRGPKPQ